VQKTPRVHRAVVLLHNVNRADLVWITPLVQGEKVEAQVELTDEAAEINSTLAAVEQMSDEELVRGLAS